MMDVAKSPAVLPDAIAYFNPRVIGRAAPAFWEAQRLHDELSSLINHHQYMRMLLHMPQGWIHTMAGGAWHALPDGHAEVYTDVIGRVLAERPGYRVTLYTGGQFYTAHSIVGRPRPADGRGFIAEPRWMNFRDPHDVRGIRDLTLQPWADIGVTGVVFDGASRFPKEIIRWRRLLRRQMKTVGVEAIPWIGSTAHGRINWYACRKGIEYHANQRYRNGRPFRETVPLKCRGRAFVWLVHMLDPPPTPQEVADMMRRGWTPVVNGPQDQLYADAVAIYGGG